MLLCRIHSVESFKRRQPTHAVYARTAHDMRRHRWVLSGIELTCKPAAGAKGLFDGKQESNFTVARW